MSPVFGSLKVYHAIETGEGGAIALISMAIDLLLGIDIAAVLVGQSQLSSVVLLWVTTTRQPSPDKIGQGRTHLARKGDHRE